MRALFEHIREILKYRTTREIVAEFVAVITFAFIFWLCACVLVLLEPLP